MTRKHREYKPLSNEIDLNSPVWCTTWCSFTGHHYTSIDSHTTRPSLVQGHGPNTMQIRAISNLKVLEAASTPWDEVSPYRLHKHAYLGVVDPWLAAFTWLHLCHTSDGLHALAVVLCCRHDNACIVSFLFEFGAPVWNLWSVASMVAWESFSELRSCNHRWRYVYAPIHDGQRLNIECLLREVLYVEGVTKFSTSIITSCAT